MTIFNVFAPLPSNPKEFHEFAKFSGSLTMDALKEASREADKYFRNRPKMLLFVPEVNSKPLQYVWKGEFFIE